MMLFITQPKYAQMLFFELLKVCFEKQVSELRKKLKTNVKNLDLGEKKLYNISITKYVPAS